MAKFIVKLTSENQDYYLEWSTTVDAPITYGMSLQDFVSYYKDVYGDSSINEFSDRMQRVEKKGTSSLNHVSAEDTISFNRAGKNETQLSIEQIINFYCKHNCKTYDDFKNHENNCPLGIDLNDTNY